MPQVTRHPLAPQTVISSIREASLEAFGGMAWGSLPTLPFPLWSWATPCSSSKQAGRS